eukprot:5749847-Prymnesium_polylepis.1
MPPSPRPPPSYPPPPLLPPPNLPPSPSPPPPQTPSEPLVEPPPSTPPGGAGNSAVHAAIYGCGGAAVLLAIVSAYCWLGRNRGSNDPLVKASGGKPSGPPEYV